MPIKARIYWAIMLVAGVAAVAVLQMFPFASRPASPWDLAAFSLVALLVGGTRISLNRLRSGDSVGSMSLGFAITFAALLRFGTATGTLIAVVGCLSSCLFPKRQKWYRIVFNVSLAAVEALAGGAIFSFLCGGKLEADPGNLFVAVAGSALSFYLVNTIGVATMIACYTGEGLRTVWNENFSWTAPSYFASACVGGVVAVAVPTAAGGVSVLFIIPIAYFVYQSYVTHISRGEERAQHAEEIQAKQSQLTNVYLTTIESLALAIDAKDQYTHSHIVRVQQYAVAIAEEMGLVGDQLDAIRTGALLHDIGKLGVPEYVLLKPGPLTREEFEKIKKHPEIGAAILEPVEFPWPVLPIVRHHHEKWDGSGYPDGLAGEQIPLNARIMAVADVYDAVTSTRSYRQAWSHERAIEMMRRDSGSHFDPRVVEAFLKVIDRVLVDLAARGVGPLIKEDMGAIPPNVKGAKAAKHIARASTELWALYEIAQSLSSSLGVKNAAQLVTKKIVDIYAGSTCVFMLWDAEGGRLNVECSYGANHDFFVDAYAFGQQSPSLRVLHENESNLGPYEATDLVLPNGRKGETFGLKTSLIVPVTCDGQAIGTINLYHTAQEAFGENDQQLLEVIAQRAASALYNGMVFDRTRGDSLKDPLTGVYNLRFLTDHIETQCDSRGAPGAGFSVLCLDLDNFKSINDGFGHSKGDMVLKDIAKIYSDCVGDDGIVARCGGDEYAIVLDRASPETAAIVAFRIESAIDRYEPDLRHPRLGRLRLGVSIGIANYPADGQDCASLMCAADNSMYAVKTERKLFPLVREMGATADMNNARMN